MPRAFSNPARRASLLPFQWPGRADPSNVPRALAEIDRVPLQPEQFRVAPAEIDHAEQGLAPEIKQAVRHAIANVRTFHESQMPEQMMAILRSHPNHCFVIGGDQRPMREVPHVCKKRTPLGSQ